MQSPVSSIEHPPIVPTLHPSIFPSFHYSIPLHHGCCSRYQRKNPYIESTIPTNNPHQIRRSFMPRYFARSSGGNDRNDLFQMMPSIFSRGGGAVCIEVTIMTIMQNIQAASARWLKVLNGPRSL